MKNICKSSILFTIATAILMVGCENDLVEFPDYDKEAVYFPIQYPIRTIVLGEDRLDNTIDREHAFNVGVSLGGMYINKSDRMVNFEVDPTLLNNIKAIDASNNTVSIKQLPTSHYSMSPSSTITIPKDSFSGLARVQLTDTFFNDPDSYKLNYVLPLRIVRADVPILFGTPAVGVANPNPHVTSDYKASERPKDFTLFAVKFINPWHGTFFHRGVQIENGVTTNVFHAANLEGNKTATIQTIGYRQAIYNTMGSLSGSSYSTKLAFSEDVDGVGDIVVSQAPGSSMTVTGSGKYYKSTTNFATKHGSWLVNPQTGKAIPHLTMTLDFEVSGITPGKTHKFVDTLVFRDNGVKFENFSVQVTP